MIKPSGMLVVVVVSCVRLEIEYIEFEWIKVDLVAEPVLNFASQSCPL